MFRIAILDDYQGVVAGMADWQSLAPEATIEIFRAHIAEEATLAERLAPFHCVVLMRERTPFPRRLIERLPNLKLLITSGMHNASIDLAAASERKVQVCGTELIGTPTSELSWGLIIALLRHIPQEVAALRQGRWQTSIGAGLAGKVLGIVGLGRNGQRMARLAKVFGMEAIAWSQNLTAEKAAEAGAQYASKDALFARADVVTIHYVLGERSRGLVGAAELQRMKPSAVLVNTSRGPIVDEAALIDALKSRRIAGAALDVYDREPLPRDHPLLALDNAILTPHLGYVIEENYRMAYGQAVEEIRAFLSGQSLRPINKLG